MKKQITYLLVSLVLLLGLPLLQACMNDSDPQKVISTATIRVLQEVDYYFLLDNGETMYPTDIKAVLNYTVENGKRVVVYCYLLDDKVDGYDYSAEIINIRDIPTKDIIPMNEDIADSIGNDPINITSWWYAGGCINFEYKYLGTQQSTKQHTVSLVRNVIDNTLTDRKDYLSLEFRHNANEDPALEAIDGIVSFRLPGSLFDLNTGLRVKVNTIYMGEEYTDMPF